VTRTRTAWSRLPAKGSQIKNSKIKYCHAGIPRSRTANSTLYMTINKTSTVISVARSRTDSQELASKELFGQELLGHELPGQELQVNYC
jgi:hypothetical protein